MTGAGGTAETGDFKTARTARPRSRNDYFDSQVVKRLRTATVQIDVRRTKMVTEHVPILLPGCKVLADLHTLISQL